jgi:hypothetical protein
MPVIDMAGVDGRAEDNVLFVFILELGVILVMVEEPACCMVRPKDGGFC